MRQMKTSAIGSNWSDLGRRTHPEGHSLNYLFLVQALESGWQIREAAKVSRHGRNGVVGYLRVYLTHPTRNLESELTLEQTSQAETLLRQHRVPVP